MNIFEIFQTQGHIEQTVVASMVQYQNHWIAFKDIIDSLFTTQQFNKVHTIETWQSIFNNSQLLVPVAIEYYRNKFETALNTIHIPEVRNIFHRHNEDKAIRTFEYVAKLYHIHRDFLMTLSHVSSQPMESGHKVSKLVENLTSKLKIVLLEQLDFHSVIQFFFKNEFLKHSRCIISTTVHKYEQETVELIKKKSSDIESRFDRSTIKRSLKFLIEIGLYDRTLAIISNISSLDLNQFIKSCQPCIDENKQFLKRCEHYFQDFHGSFEMMIEQSLAEILSFDQKNEYIQKLKKNQQKYRNNIYFFYTKLCNKKVFDIILAYPESHNIVMELKKAIERTNMLPDLAESVNESISKRLLIPGVITQNILNQYISMLKILQILDPNGIVFDRITLPIKAYLLKRSDTLRCIINHLTEDVENYSKLTRQVVKIPSKEYIDEEMSSDENEQAAEKWQVLPLVHKNSQIRVKYQQFDLVTVLVNLYGSQQAFISEYQNMLAEKLMSAKQYNIDEQIKNIQLLKLRFGESALQTCNIIVKDVKDSKRTDNLIHKQPVTDKNPILHPSNLHCLNVSKGYWPINYDSSSFSVPTFLKPVFDDYASKFTQIKAMRKIQWHYNLGYVNLSLSFDNGEFKFKCLPIHAILISYFDQDRLKDGNGISIETLSKELNISQNIIKQRMSFWIHKSVIRQSRVYMSKGTLPLRRMNSYDNENQTIFYHPAKIYEKVSVEDDILHDQTDEMIMKEGASLESHMTHVIEGLILSILNTNGAKSAQRIHLLLKTVYKNDLNYNLGESQTKEILKKMLGRKKLTFNGETYSAIMDR